MSEATTIPEIKRPNDGGPPAEKRAEVPPSIGLMLGSAGGPVEFDVAGKTYKLGHPTQKARVRLEKLLIRRATESITCLEGTLNAADYRKMFDGLMRQVRNKEFETWGPAWQTSILESTQKSIVLFALSLLQEYHPTLTEDDVEEMLVNSYGALPLAIIQVVPSFFLLTIQSLKISAESKAKVMPQIEEQIKAMQEALIMNLKTMAENAGWKISTTATSEKP